MIVRRCISGIVGGLLATLCATVMSAQQPAANKSVATTQTSTTPTAPAAPVLTTTAIPGRQSWLSDKRDYQIGDIVTIQVDEYTLTSLDKRVDATDARQRDLGMSIATPTDTKNMGFGTRNNSTSQTRGSDARNNRLVTEMSARVVEIGPNRQMKLEGTKSLHVEKSIINISLSGWTRAQDVSSQNIVASARLADAKLDYQAEGPLGSPKSGILGRILGKFWP